MFIDDLLHCLKMYYQAYCIDPLLNFKSIQQRNVFIYLYNIPELSIYNTQSWQIVFIFIKVSKNSLKLV